MSDLTVERLREVLIYDQETGVFVWRIWRNGRTPEGMQAGKTQNGYRRIRIDGRSHMAHRLAWFYMNGTWPTHLIDHINGDRSDNRISNLRDVTFRVNKQNMRKARSDNKTGFLGVSKCGSKFKAEIEIDGTRNYLGLFDTALLAYGAYVERKRQLHEGCTL